MSIISQARLELFPYYNPGDSLRLKQLDKKWVKFFWIFLFIALLFHGMFFVGNLIRRLNILDTTPPPLTIEIVAPRGSAPDAGEEKKPEPPLPEQKEKVAPKPLKKSDDPNSPIEKAQPTPKIAEPIKNEEKPVPPAKKEEAPKPEEKPTPPSIPEKSVEKSAPTVDADKYADYLKNPKPAYPMGPYREGIEGTVWLRVQVLEDGTVGSVELAQTSGNDELDQSALNTVKKWRFKPAVQGGQASTQFIRIPITFKLQR
jgi:protein TonB